MSDYEAGRELDELMATLMGWTLETGPSYWPNTEQVWRNALGQRMGTIDTWQPSSQIAAAWQVLQHMRTQGYCWQLLCPVTGNVAFCMWTEPRAAHVTRRGETMALAICRAALAAHRDRGMDDLARLSQEMGKYD